MKSSPPKLAQHEDAVVVGVGASAGGLDALKRFFQTADSVALPAAYIVVQHLDPKHESILGSLLGKEISMPVVQARDGMALEPGRVHICPSGHRLSLRNRRLRLEEQGDLHGVRTGVDELFASLAREYGARAVGVVLSGSGSDGASGLREIAASGGLCAAQHPLSAEYHGMPQSAVDTGVVHIVRLVEELPEAIRQALSTETNTAPDGFASPEMRELLELIRARRGTDFRHYKPSTILRRVARRMGMLRVENLGAYIVRLREDQDEFAQLCDDLLIGVTRFFRDPEVFDFVRDELVEKVVDHALAASPGGEGDAELRVWVAGCSTGEEAYTVGVLLLEAIRLMAPTCTLQLFASDIDDTALEFARKGVYPASAMADFPPELLERYFVRAGAEQYEASKKLRESLVFAHQDLLADPPFSRLDLITCRNLLIYLNPDVQGKILSVFHFALRPCGYLVLGGSESIGRNQQRFHTVSRAFRVYQRGDEVRGSLPTMPLPRLSLTPSGSVMPTNNPQPPRQLLGADVQKWLNERYAPAAVVVDEHQQIVHFANQAHRYLMIPEGEPTHDLAGMLDETSATRIKAMISHAVRTDEPQPARPVVLRRPARVPERTPEALVGVVPFSLGDPSRRLFMVTFQELSEEQSGGLRGLSENEVIAQLEQELRATREDLQSTIEEMEATNEELKAANEESMSVNEELQSANEELETSKEELQSLNEELNTVNSQLRDNLEEVEQVNNDISNLLTSTDLGVLFLDSMLRIKRFTPGITDLFRMVPGDIDRPVGDIARRFKDGDLEQDARRVLDRLDRSEKNIVAQNGRIYQQRILPYRTHENRIEGVVIVYSDVTDTQRTLSNLARANLQKSALAQLSASMINMEDLQEFYELAVKLAMQALDADFTKILRLLPKGDEVELVAGLGWSEAVGPGTRVSTGKDSQAGYTLMTDSPVVVANLEQETRFHGPALLTDHGVLSGISCTIRGPDGSWGVLGVHSRTERNFSEEDVDFVSSMASLIGQALQLLRTRERLEGSSRRLEFALRSAEIGAWEFSSEHGVIVWAGRQRQLLGLGAQDPESIDAFWARVHPDDRGWLRKCLSDSFADRKDYRADFRIILPSGDIRWLHGAGSVFEDPERGLLMYGVNFDITPRKVLESKLEEHQQQLKAQVQQQQQLANDRLREIRRMSHEMVIAESVERRRLANELHDNLAQLLNLAVMRLSSLGKEVPGDTGKRVSDIRQIMQQAIDTTRSVMDQLTPQVLDELGLGPAIDWLAEQTKELYNLHVDVRHRTEPIGISRESQLIVFRAVRELLINVARHARIDRAMITVSRAGPMLCIEVHDKGRGFDPGKILRQTQRRYGLLGMQERISHIGGTVNIESHPNDGSTVWIEIPDPTPSEESDEQD